MWKTPIPFDLIESVLPNDVQAQLIVVKLIARANRETGEFYYGYEEVAGRFDKNISRARRKMQKIRQATDKQTDMQATIKPTNKGTVGVWENYHSLTGMRQATDKQTDTKPTTNIDKNIRKRKSNTVYCASTTHDTKKRPASLSCKPPAHGTPPPTPSPSVSKSPSYSQEFEEVWELYPVKKGKHVAFLERQKLDEETRGLVKFAIVQYTHEMTKQKQKYIKHGSTRMKQKIYFDYKADYDAQKHGTNITKETRELTPTQIKMMKNSKYGYGTVCYVGRQTTSGSDEDGTETQTA